MVNKSFGWEIFDLRYGALLMRIDTAISRIDEYLKKELSNIEELETERLAFRNPGPTYCNNYFRIVSASRISYELWMG